MTSAGPAAQMRRTAAAFLAALDEQQRTQAALAFDDVAARRWLEYRPASRPGACLAMMSPRARKAAHLLLATALSDHCYAQAMAIMSLEEVLDLREQQARDRHSGDYWVSVFGDPGAGDAWSWRFEGHHLSVTMTVRGDAVSPAPVFLGANPARVSYAGRPVSWPLAPEEDLARALLDALGPAGRLVAVVADQAPRDIRTGTAARARRLEPLGIPASALGPTSRAILDQLVALYLDRMTPSLAAQEATRIAPAARSGDSSAELHFAWEGPLTPGTRHYYRVQGDDLLIEYDNTQDDGNHAHTVLRRPDSDFGADILAAHYTRAHAPMA